MEIIAGLGLKITFISFSSPIMNSSTLGDHFLLQKTLKSGNIGIKCSPYAGSNKAYAAFGSSRVLATLRERARALHLHVKIE